MKIIYSFSFKRFDNNFFVSFKRILFKRFDNNFDDNKTVFTQRNLAQFYANLEKTQ